VLLRGRELLAQFLDVGAVLLRRAAGYLFLKLKPNAAPGAPDGGDGDGQAEALLEFLKGGVGGLCDGGAEGLRRTPGPASWGGGPWRLLSGRDLAGLAAAAAKRRRTQEGADGELGGHLVVLRMPASQSARTRSRRSIEYASIAASLRGCGPPSCHSRQRRARTKIVTALKGLLDATGGLPITILSGPAYDALHRGEQGASH